MSMIGRVCADLWSEPSTRGGIVGAFATALLALLGWGGLHILSVVRQHDMAISVQDPVVTGDSIQVTVGNDGDRPGKLYGALVSVQPNRADQNTEFTFQLLPSETTPDVLINPETPTFISLPLTDRWRGATNELGVFLGRVLDAQSAIDKGLAHCSLILILGRKRLPASGRTSHA
jgi:hypothetical protein